MPSVLWRRVDGAALERCTIDRTNDGHRIAGTVLLARDGAPHEIRYSVLLDHDWHPRTVGAHVQGPEGDRRLALSSDGAGSWSASDAPLIELYGATDIELTWTPATHLAVIRRVGLEVGQAAETTFAVVDYPAHDLGRTTATYTRTAFDSYTVAVRGDAVALQLEPGGVALRQPGTWEPVATT